MPDWTLRSGALVAIRSVPTDVWETQRRGVISGESLTTRNGIMQENLVSFAPSRFEAGCVGIDLFGGSFSFINAKYARNTGVLTAQELAFITSLPEDLGAMIRNEGTARTFVSEASEYIALEMTAVVIMDMSRAVYTGQARVVANVLYGVTTI